MLRKARISDGTIHRLTTSLRERGDAVPVPSWTFTAICGIFSYTSMKKDAIIASAHEHHLENLPEIRSLLCRRIAAEGRIGRKL